MRLTSAVGPDVGFDRNRSARPCGGIRRRPLARCVCRDDEPAPSSAKSRAVARPMPEPPAGDNANLVLQAHGLEHTLMAVEGRDPPTESDLGATLPGGEGRERSEAGWGEYRN